MSEANTSQRHDTAFSLVPLAFDTIATWQLYVIEAMDPIITLATIIATTDIGVFLAQPPRTRMYEFVVCLD